MHCLSKNLLEKIQVYILSRDRPDFLKECIDSVLKQVDVVTEFDLIISDNSVGNKVSEMILENYSKKDFKYIKIDPPLSSKEHFDFIVSNLNSKYAVLLHDDDLLHPNYMKIMSLAIREKNIVAVGCNAMIFKDNIFKSRIRAHIFKSSKKFDNESSFLKQYLPGNGGNAPFPSYIYLTKYLKKVYLNPPIQGKHRDVALLSSLLNYGKILWLEKPLMYYRVHDSNDSILENIPDRIRLMNYMKKNNIDKKSTKFLLYRLLFWTRWIKSQERSWYNLKSWKFRKVIPSIIIKSLLLFKRKIFWMIILKRYLKK